MQVDIPKEDYLCQLIMNSDIPIHPMQCSLILHKLSTLLIPNASQYHKHNTTHPLFEAVIMYMIGSSFALCIWICLSCVTCKVISVLGECIQITINRVCDIFVKLVECSAQLVRDTGTSIYNLTNVLLNAIYAIWCHMSRDNLSLIIALGMIIYAFPELCDIVKELLRRQVISWGSKGSLK